MLPRSRRSESARFESRPLLALLFLLISFLLLGSAPPAHAVTHNVSVQNNVFVPASITITEGDVVQWNWVAGIHNTTSGTVGNPNGIWAAPINSSNPSFQRTFNTPGAFPYYCTFHGGLGMTGNITVQPAVTILVQDFQFVPAQAQIIAGQHVRWQWVNGSHTTTSGVSSNPADNPGALWDAPVDAAHPSFLYQFTSPGVFPFFCRPHELSGMSGSVMVGSPSAVGDAQTGGFRFHSSPNPFASQVRLFADLAQSDKVTVEIFDLNGRRVLSLLVADLPAGRNGVNWGGWDENHQPVAPGVYFARLQSANGQSAVLKLFKTR